MNLEKSLNSALGELWRAALSISALKHLAGMVKAELSLVSNNADEGADKKHDLSHDQPVNICKFENVFDKFAEEITLEDDAIEYEEEEDKDFMFDDEETVQTDEDERMMYQSSVTHSVTTPDITITETDIPMMTSSMVAHCHSPLMEDSLPELGEALTSLQAHIVHDQHLVPAQECQEDILEECQEQQDVLEVCQEQEDIWTPDEDRGHPETVSIDEKILDVEENKTAISDMENKTFTELEKECRENEFYTKFMDQYKNDDDEPFLISMVSHQLPNLAPQDDYPAAIMSSAAHHHIKIEAEEIESNTSMLTHFTENFCDSGNFEDVNEEETIELTEDALDDFTEYTEVDHLDTIIEVSEMCDITDAAEMTESEMFEDTEDYSIIEDKINLLPEPEIIHSYSFDMSYGNVTSDYYCQSYTEEDQSFIEEEEESCYSEYQDPLMVEEELFLPSMVAHHLPLHDTPHEFHDFIMSMTSHMTTAVEEDCLGSGTTSLSHFTRCNTGIIEEEPEEEAIEDFTEYTDVYTEVDYLDTIQEVSEMFDTSDQTDMTETELFEEMEEFVNFSESVDIKNSPYEILESFSTIHESGLEEETHESTAKTMEETSIQEEDIITNPELQEDEVVEEGDFLPSMVSHCVDTSEEEYTMLPSPATHHIVTVTETNDFNSMVAYQQLQSCLNPYKLEEGTLEQESISTSIETECITEAILFGNSDQDLRTKKETEFITNKDSQLPQEYPSCQEPAPSSTSVTTINEESEQEDGKNTVQSYKLQLTRIQELQKLVEDELEEFDTKRKNKPINIEQATESQIVNIVKGVEFVTTIKINQMYEDSAESIMPKMLPSPLPFRRETIKQPQKTEDKSQANKNTIELFSDEEEDASDLNVSGDNLVLASCTLRGDNTVSIRSSYAGSDDLNIPSETEEGEEIIESSSDKKEKEEEHVECTEKKDDLEDKLNELKIPIRAPPRKSVIRESKIRDKELLESMLAQAQTTADKPQNIQMTDNNEEKKDLASILKPSKTTVKVASATLNESSSKQSYRIKFKVKLNENSQRKQTSVLRYLFGCFGGEKLFNSQQK